MSRFRITNLEEIKAQILAQTSDQIRDRFNQAIINSKDLLIDDIIEVMTQTETWRGIRGDFQGSEDFDIQAQMGLSQGFANDTLEQIIEAVRNSFTVEFRGARGRGAGGQFASLINSTSVTVFIGFPTLAQEISSIPNASYFSNGNEVPWLDWLINGGDVTGYQITFALNNIEQTVSRSGRALMLKSEYGNWDTADYAFGQRDNFVVETFENEELIDQMTNTIANNFAALV